MDIAQNIRRSLSFAFLLILIGFTGLSGQSILNAGLKTKQVSWQQHVDHKISVTLDPEKKTLDAEETIVYKNNSPDELKEIWMHVWPNAFKDNSTAYGKEAIMAGNTKFFNAKKSDRGWVEGLNFTVNGVQAKWEYSKENKDIVRVILPAPLSSGATATIHTPFKVKIPWLFSRMGVNKGIFSITQWYPKPAVYDVNGWNAFPYLEQGEYYSEFGDYDVQITVPKNFRVGATGILQDTNELNWLANLKTRDSTITNTTETKTLHYVQQSVADFAWFASDKFEVKHGETTLPNGHIVKTFAFFIWSKSSLGDIIGSIDKALQYYSGRVGNYPYDFCSVVIGPLQGAGGMEYPMITICADASEGTIVHEVGHNWFQGMLGSQERNHPWMDESINTFYHNQATSKTMDEFSPGDKIGTNSTYLQFRVSNDLGLFQEGNLHSSEYQKVNYGTIVYGANPRRFMFLQEYLGHTVFDSCMKTYFRKWQYKHPLPGDFQNVFEQVSQQKLDWFFNGLLGGSAPDFAISSVKRTKSGIRVKINNKGTYAIPVNVSSRRSTLKDVQWIPGRDTTITINAKSEEVSLNPSGYLTESNIANNDAKTRGILKTWGKLKIGLPNLYTRGTNRVWVFPNVFAFNSYDGYMPGLIISNLNFPRRNWEWWALPMYATNSKFITGVTGFRRRNNITGIAGLRRNIFHKSGPFSLTEMSLNFSTFSFTPNKVIKLAQTLPGGTPELNLYYHLAPKVNMYFKRKTPWIQNVIELEYDRNRIEKAYQISTLEKPQRTSPDLQNNLFRIAFVKNVYKKLNPQRYMFQLDGGRNIKTQSPSADSAFKFIKATAVADYFLPYRNKRKKISGLRIKAYAEGFVFQKNSNQSRGVYNPVISGANGGNDYGYRQLIQGRSEAYKSGSTWSNQLLSNSLGLHMLPNMVAKSWVAGANIESHIYPGFPLQVFADAVIANTAVKSAGLFYAAGVKLSQHTNSNVAWEVCLPLLYSKNISNQLLGSYKWYNLINFRININLLNAFTIARDAIQ